MNQPARENDWAFPWASVFRSVDQECGHKSLRSIQVLTFCHHDFHHFFLFLHVPRYEKIQENLPGGCDLLKGRYWETWWKTQNIEITATPTNISQTIFFLGFPELPHPWVSGLDPASQVTLLSCPWLSSGQGMVGVTFLNNSNMGCGTTYHISKGHLTTGMCDCKHQLSIFWFPLLTYFP